MVDFVPNLSDQPAYEVGGIGNYYGGLSIRIHEGVPQWSIENWDGHDWEPISLELYQALAKHHEELYT